MGSIISSLMMTSPRTGDLAVVGLAPELASSSESSGPDESAPPPEELDEPDEPEPDEPDPDEPEPEPDEPEPDEPEPEELELSSASGGVGLSCTDTPVSDDGKSCSESS
jgi:hypothetical protein